MAEHIQCLDGGDRSSALVQAQAVFLQGCGLPAAWAATPRWRILETDFGLGLNFLATWAAWRADPQHCRMLHFVSLEACPVAAADLLHAARQYPDLLPLAQELHDQFWGLLPGVHRLSFDNGQVLLTLCIGDAPTLLRQQNWTVDSIYLNGFSSERNPYLLSAHSLKALARCCRRGTRLATSTVEQAVRDALAQCGFDVRKAPGVASKCDKLQATFDPHWEPRSARPAALALQPARCVVIGSGLAGAATAASLARRGWQVQVLDAGATPASGASGLPAGLFAPYLSPDDNQFSRVSRSGVRAMLQQCAALLHSGVDWAPSGVLERRPPDRLGIPSDWTSGLGSDWCGQASEALLHTAGLPSGTSACWHVRAGWLRPAQLVAALLAQPGIAWRGNTSVAQLQRLPEDAQGSGDSSPVWRVVDTQGRTAAEAELVVLAAGLACNVLLAGIDPSSSPLPLQPVRGQLSWGLQDVPATSNLPPFPVNGHGGLVAHVPQPGGGYAWYMGSTFERDVDQLPMGASECAAAHASNWHRLQELLPDSTSALQAAFDPTTLAGAQQVQAWASVRCTTHDRLPIVGPVNATDLPGLWVSTAMGARGLTRAVLCGELLAAQLHDEPLPLEAKLARALMPRFVSARA